MSCPDLDCASAAPVSSSLLAWVVMKSTVTSTFSFSPHSLMSAEVASLALGTQWSQKPTDSLPAACAPRTNGAATRPRAVPATTTRRETLDCSMTFVLPEGTRGHATVLADFFDRLFHT